MKKVSRQPLLLGMAVMCVVGTVYGCSDFLTDAAKPQGTLDEGTLANRAGVEGTLIAAYRQLDHTNGVGGAWASAASNWIWGSVTSDDAYKGSEATDQPAIDPIEQYQWSAPNVEGELNDKWRAMYEGVVRSNATINLLKSVTASKPGEISAADAKGIEGEALFLRAHYHFEAWRMWGNIPYFRETDKDFGKANLASGEVVTEILKDLDAAIALLLTAPRNGDVGRATQWTAKAYKGRVQVHAGQFAAGLATLREVRASGRYALEESFDRVWTGFKEYENGKETILAYQASANDLQPNGDNANWGARLTFPHSGSPFGCCGFHQPSQNLVNFFATDAATGLPAALTNANWNASNANFSAGSPAPVDPRLDFTVGRDRVPYKDWGPHAPDWIRSPSYGGVYSNKKNVHEKASGAQSNVGWVNTQLNSVNVHMYRYADLLLLLAEAEVEAGSMENARTIVNEIRARAAVRAQGPGTDRATIAVPINDPSITWATYKIGLYTAPFAGQAAARAAVRNERRLELAMEGQRFFDLRRWGIAEQVLNSYINGVAGGAEKARRVQLTGAALFSPRHAVFPIPPIQIELSKGGESGGLKQNTGW
ncbi:MAG: RagB/SusD family nutrient uptake outer membrane protein [Gemmatimonadaceae bacterium]|nr:RagB/SusD family nutrient uptake outer membrane protein [Gemmatimonadaceae bacterium]